MPGEGKVHRDWLSYSETEDRVYCLHCMLFGKGDKPAWTVDGFHAWQRANQALITHETSTQHIEATLKANIKEVSVPLLPSLEQGNTRTKAINREIVRILNDVILYLGRHLLAFRGYRESSKEALRGNFQDLVALLVKYSPALSTYLSHLEAAKTRRKIKFLSPNHQNQIIDSIAQVIRNVVMKEIKEEDGVFSVAIDTTFDSSKKEQLSFVVRYVDENTCSVVERLVALKESPSTKGDRLFETFKEVCDELGLDWRTKLVGQSYDGALNMRAEFAGLQGRVQRECPSALFIWCTAHRLNLAVVELSKSCSEAVDMFGNLEAVFSFVGSSKNRSKLYRDFQKQYYPSKRGRMLKRVKATRWMSEDDSLETCLDTFEAVVSTLDEEHYSQDASALSEARGLQNYFLSQRFVMTALLYRKIFTELSPVNKVLQKNDIDFLAAMDSIER